MEEQRPPTEKELLWFINRTEALKMAQTLEDKPGKI